MPEISRTQVATTAAIVFVVAFVGARSLAGQRAAGDSGASGPRATSSATRGATDAVAAGPTGEAQPAVAIDDPGAMPAVVHVAGAVRRPGVYRLPAGARVDDAIRRAGGPRRSADLDGVNLAAKLLDGQQILVPRRAGRGASPGGGPAAGAVAPATAGAPTGGGGQPLDLNAATEAQLETLDGVGPATAQKILAYRQQHGGFRSVDELAEVSGIGPKKLAALRGAVRV